jgi:hypothetical protein
MASSNKAQNHPVSAPLSAIEEALNLRAAGPWPPSESAALAIEEALNLRAADTSPPRDAAPTLGLRPSAINEDDLWHQYDGLVRASSLLDEAHKLIITSDDELSELAANVSALSSKLAARGLFHPPRRRYGRLTSDDIEDISIKIISANDAGYAGKKYRPHGILSGILARIRRVNPFAEHHEIMEDNSKMPEKSEDKLISVIQTLHNYLRGEFTKMHEDAQAIIAESDAVDEKAEKAISRSRRLLSVN